MIRYFLDRDGVPTTRIVNAPGKSHLDIAKQVLLATQAIAPDTDLYDSMFRLGYARVRETTTALQVETPAIEDSESLSENAVERGCVADQPQPPVQPGRRTHESVLRLVEDDTAALRNFQTGSKAGKHGTEGHRKLTRKQASYLQARAAALKVPLVLNTREMVNSKEIARTSA